MFVTGNPGVTERDPYPTRTKPQPVIRVGVSAGRGRGSGGFFFYVAGSRVPVLIYYIMFFLKLHSNTEKKVPEACDASASRAPALDGPSCLPCSVAPYP